LELKQHHQEIVDKCTRISSKVEDGSKIALALQNASQLKLLALEAIQKGQAYREVSIMEDKLSLLLEKLYEVKRNLVKAKQERNRLITELSKVKVCPICNQPMENTHEELRGP
jgi:DNA repair exonuclease SbcCD ATPase subunit